MTCRHTVSRPRAVGANQPAGSHISADTTRAETPIQSAGATLPASWRDSRPQQGKPFIHPFELGSSLLFLGLALSPIAIVGGLVIGYLAFAPQPIQY